MKAIRWKAVSLVLILAASIGCHGGAFAAPLQTGPGPKDRTPETRPYKLMMDDPLEFSGYDDKPSAPAGLESIPLGLYAPNAAEGRPGRCLFQGAQLALEEINAAGGFDRHPFKLIRRWAENPWNAGSREMLRLAYQDHVPAVIGYMSDASHIAEQIATKAYLPIITPISSDPSLTHARVPWIFRLPPDDAVQARVLVDQGLLANGFKRPGLITGTDQDSRMAEARILATLKGRRTPPLFHLMLPVNGVDYQDITRRIEPFKPDSLILRLPPDALTALVKHLNQAGIDCPLLMPWIPGWDPDDAGLTRLSPLILVEPFDRSIANQRFTDFSTAYLGRFGEPPSFTAAYAYDAAHILAESLQAGGLSRKGVRDALASLSGRQGVTGPILWDNGGGNLAEPVIRLYPARIQKTSRKSEATPIP